MGNSVAKSPTMGNDYLRSTKPIIKRGIKNKGTCPDMVGVAASVTTKARPARSVFLNCMGQ